MAAVADKKDVAAPAFEDQWAGGLKIMFDDFPGRNSKGDKSFLVALAYNPDEAGCEIARSKGDRDQF